MPRIPVVGISYDYAKEILKNYTNAYQVNHNFWYGLPLNTSVQLNFTAEVEVYRNENSVTLNNVIGTIPGRYELLLKINKTYEMKTIQTTYKISFNLANVGLNNDNLGKCEFGC